MDSKSRFRFIFILLCAWMLLLLAGCGSSNNTEPSVAKDAPAAASQLESAFGTAPETVRNAAAAAAAAMRQKDYEKAVASLQVARAGNALTIEQGLAVHSSVVALEGELLAAAAGGDTKARQAYELLKAMKSK